uniref:T9SS type A sorting domain-containing protein n=2 Tax=candidate division WOR-3 bacterium TaxID=2052148 RepID=A0A7C4W7I7_UNCW3
MKRIIVFLIPLIIFAKNPLAPKNFGFYSPTANSNDFQIGFWDLPKFDPLFSLPSLSKDLIIDSYPQDGLGYYLIQFNGPVYRYMVEEIRNLGVLTLGFHSRYLLIGKMDNKIKERVEKLPYIRWVGIYQPGYKFAQTILKDRESGILTLTLFYPEDLISAVNDLTNKDFKIIRYAQSEYFKVIEVEAKREDIPILASLPYIFSIEEWHPPELENANCQWVIQTWAQENRRIWEQGIYGVNEILGYTDTGLDILHWAFYDPNVSISDTGEYLNHRKVVFFKNWETYQRPSDPDGHGTHVGGTIGGNDSLMGGTNPNDGHSKGCRIGILAPIPQPTGWDLTGPFNKMTNWLRNPELKVYTISNSWWTGTMGQYTNASASVDIFSWVNKDVIIIKSCGNQGQSTQYRITEPGNSKSIIACGSLQNGLNSTVLSSYSSRGPAPDGRIKPDLCVPGEGIYSADAGTQNGYVSMSGTSMAAPAVNGACGLIRSYLKRGFYPSGVPNPDDSFPYISASLVKACLIVSCDPNIGNYVIPSEYVGWGRVNLDSVLYFATPVPDRRKLLLYDDTIGLRTGEYVEYEFEVNDNIPLRIAVVWTDTAAAPGANPALINNLDVLLTSPSGNFYKGNIYQNGQSVQNPTQPYDNINPLEVFRINQPELGRWNLKIMAQNVVTSIPQPYSVVITGGIQLRPRTGVRYLAHYLIDEPPMGNGDRILNPGEEVEIPTWFKNHNDYEVEGVKIYLRLRQPDTNVVILDSFKYFSSIAPFDSVFTGEDGFNIRVSENLPNGYSIPLVFSIEDTLDSIWESRLTLYVGTPILVNREVVVYDSPPNGNNNGRLDPNEIASLTIGIKNQGLGNGYNVYAVLKSLDERLIILDSIGIYDTIFKDSTKFNNQDKFVVQTLPNIPPETPIPCSLRIYSDQYIFSSYLTIVIGELRITDPIPDNASPIRYWAYDDVDSFYVECPDFEWVEIRGVGERLPISSDDQTIRIPLPFPIYYYGVRYSDSLSICGNGWISPIRTTSTVYTNQPLPDPTSTNPSAMICVNWDDLYPPTGNGIWFYYDTLNHRMILEWDSVHYYNPRASWDKFQIIIYDTTVRTYTGDNEIVFQYLTANNYTSNTVGIEDQTNTIGINALYNNTYHRACAPIVAGRAIKFTTDTIGYIGIKEFAKTLENKKKQIIVANPQKILKINLPYEEAQITIFDVFGRKIREFNLKGSMLILDFKDKKGKKLGTGIYTIRIKTNNETIIKKIIYIK